jgi:RHS repeat-associated protein
MNIKYYLAATLYCFLLPIVINAQILETGKEIIKKDPINDRYNLYTYEARDKITLLPGFSITGYSTGGSLDAHINKQVLVPPSVSTTQNNENRTLNTDLTVGTTIGLFEVDDNGNASYQIPVQIPSGSNDLNPNIGLTYNSGLRDGIAGYGCTISGIMEISRTITNDFYDFDKEVPFHSNDFNRFSLNGDRLIIKNGQNGIVGSEYHTAIESFQKISYLSTGSIDYFMVEKRDGLKLYFGNTIDSRQVNNDGIVQKWFLTKIIDLNGNFIEFHYRPEGENSNSIVPDYISYTGNGSMAPKNKIQFCYTTKNIHEYFHAGTLIKSSFLLDKIEVTTSNGIYREYQLSYFKNYNNMYLSSVTEFGTDKNSYNKTLINYSEKPNIRFSNIYYGEDVRFNRITPGDFDGDGVDEVLIIPNGIFSSSDIIKILYSNGTTKSYPAPVGYSGVSISDYNGDGQEDILFHKGNENDSYNIYKSGKSSLRGVTSITDLGILIQTYNHNSDSFVTIQSNENNYGINFTIDGEYELLNGDVNNDGLCDLVYTKDTKTRLFICNMNSGKISFSLKHSITDDKDGDFYLIDYNGDNRIDLLKVKDDGADIFIYNTDSELLETAKVSTTINNEKDISLGDVNGDGKVDLMYDGDVFYSPGVINAGSDNSLIKLRENNYYHKQITHDFNNDGSNDYSEILVQSTIVTFPGNKPNSYLEIVKNSLDIKVTNNSGTFTRHILTDYEVEVLNYFFRDFDGDGDLELFIHFKALDYDALSTQGRKIPKGYFSIFNFNSDYKTLVASTIIDGFNKKTNIHYQTKLPEINENLDISLSYPARILKTPLTTVRSVEESNGIGGVNTMEYRFFNPKIHLKGIGYLGYTQIEKHNIEENMLFVKTKKLETNLYTDSNINNSLYIYGTSSPIKETRETLGYQLISSSAGIRFYGYVENEILEDNSKGTSISKTYNYNHTTGNLNYSLVNFGSGTTVKTIYSDYVEAGSYMKNKPSLISIEKTHGDEPGITFINKTYYSYDPKKGNLLQEIANYQLSDKEISTFYKDHNVFGQPQEILIQGNDISAISNKYTYDNQGRITSKSDAIHRIDYFYDEITNQVIRETDQNNLSTVYTYDGFGKLKTKKSPDGTTNTIIYDWAINEVGNSIYYTYLTCTGKAWIKSYMDMFGRTLKKESVGYQNISLIDETSYNAKGQVINSYQSIGDNIQSINYSYYADGNLKSKDYSNGKLITYSYFPLEKKISVNEDGKVIYNFYDNAGNTDKIIENYPGGGEVNYSYYASGLPHIIEALNMTIIKEYDAVGNLTSIEDPNTGKYTYSYNALGQLTYQNNERAESEIFLHYDELNRITKKTTDIAGDELLAQFSYYSDGREIGLLKEETNNTVYRVYKYDNLLRLSEQIETIEDKVYTSNFKYGTGSRLESIQRNNELMINYGFDDYSNMTSIDANNTRIWTLNSLTEDTYAFQLGNGLITTNLFDENRMLSEIKTLGNGLTIQDLEYEFNPVNGNLLSRKNKAHNSIIEEFKYDNHQRLYQVKHNGTSVLDIDYDEESGNILSKLGSDDNSIGDYKYASSGNAGPNAVTSIVKSNTSHPERNQQIQYNVNNLVEQIIDGPSGDENIMNFIYGPANQRKKVEFYKNSSSVPSYTKYYSGNLEEIINQDGNNRRIYYISCPSGVVAMYEVLNSEDNFFYIHSDHLGSILTITNSNKEKVLDIDYDAWGNRRNPVTLVLNNTVEDYFINRGYTRHEHMDMFGLINMNGRLYDPKISMFLSPDPFIQAPNLSINYNRYSYCLNNPLKYTDPTGYKYNPRSEGNIPRGRINDPLIEGDAPFYFNDMDWLNYSYYLSPEAWIILSSPRGSYYSKVVESQSFYFHIEQVLNYRFWGYIDDDGIVNQTGSELSSSSTTIEIEITYNRMEYVTSIPDSESEVANSSGGMDPNNILTPIGLVASYTQDLVSTSVGSNGRFYSSGWRGNQYVSTLRLSTVGQVVSVGGFFVGGVFTIYDVNRQISQGADPTNTIAIGTLETGISALGTWGGPVGWMGAGIMFLFKIADKGYYNLVGPAEYQRVQKAFYGYTDSNGGIHGTDYGEFPMP